MSDKARLSLSINSTLRIVPQFPMADYAKHTSISHFSPNPIRLFGLPLTLIIHQISPELIIELIRRVVQVAVSDSGEKMKINHEETKSTKIIDDRGSKIENRLTRDDATFYPLSSSAFVFLVSS